ncbi:MULTISPECIES: purine-nucleoside phosphorylase [Carnobacterium]|uniref:Purine nucleoside phosphorylase DeoD-type n=1 Tax=Carnobacterium maltaromaticum TaxID=2751 RepID=A0AAW9K0Y2_CARML|nr:MULTISPECIES: purine-nucleoside phosphorylase [Carnobacterium]KRN74247.1 purine nucleoside phosphorylase [Carnobacterium maltaromaticum]KRN87735.1 purine nucleoside phosphorylase [Carnobacterium maltaromaticum]MBC9788707.1 purine-nucleoside phosphorylase [Carnobacterium maltaromaticum]MBC9809121.1 purine-nucleoside phosphorylase [Carnobacterium maltaromaticum]MBQ6485458.1 purine-nucleoside phosphorylase [Carnobacterium sp.]
MSIHIEAQKGQIAETVLLPGDPLRAKYIAETFLTEVEQYNRVRNMFGYTGLYKGERISVQGTGMGLPSMMIYAEELITEYNVQNLIRVGTAGGMQKDVKVRDVVLAQAATTDSSINRNTFGGQVDFAPIADFDLLKTAYDIGTEKGLSLKVGNVLSADRFYNAELDKVKLANYGILAVEMEAAGLYSLAAKHNRKALAILTISDHIFTGEETSSDERERTFTDMMIVALETGLKQK